MSFFDYEAKYVAGKSNEITPARIEESIRENLTKLTNKVHEALGLGYYSRSGLYTYK